MSGRHRCFSGRDYVRTACGWSGSDARRSGASWIHGLLIDPNLVVKMRSGGMPAVSDETYGGALLDALSSLHGKSGQVSIETVHAVPVLENDCPAVPGPPAGESDDAFCRRADRCPGASADIDTGVDVASSSQRAPCSEAGIDRSAHRPVHPQCGERIDGVTAGAGPLRRGPSSECSAGHNRRNTYHSQACQGHHVHSRCGDLKAVRAVPARSRLRPMRWRNNSLILRARREDRQDHRALLQRPSESDAPRLTSSPRSAADHWRNPCSAGLLGT